MPSLESAQEQLTIRQGRIDLSFHQIVGEVFEYVLSDPRLFLSVPTSASTSASSKGEPPSISVKVSSASHADAFAALQRGENDILIGWFDGSHGTYVDSFREDVVILGESRDPSSIITPPIYTPYCIWGVPSYVPKAIVPSVQSLADPSVAARFKVTSTSGKRIIQGIAPGAGISRFSKEMVESYGLAELEWQFQSGSQEDCFGAFERAVEKEGEQTVTKILRGE
jgi:glycine betaine/proline transport system substrate-binding protein